MVPVAERPPHCKVVSCEETTTMSMEGDEHPDDFQGEGGENEPTKRSERKRQREKQRRTDLTKSFDELASFIFQIEPEAGDPDVATDAKKKKKRSSGGGGTPRNDPGEEASGITRLDLIGRALRIMKRLHRENEERKRMIEHMRERRSGPPSNDNVLVMVPTLSPADEASPVARASYPPPYYHHQGGPPPMPPHPPEYMIRHPPSGYPPHGGPSHQPPPHSHWGSYGRGPPPQHGGGGPPPHHSQQQLQHGGPPPHGNYPPSLSGRSAVSLPNAPPVLPDGRNMH